VEVPLLVQVDRCCNSGAWTDPLEEVALSTDDALEGVCLRNILVMSRPGDPGLAVTGVFAVKLAVGVVGVSVE
jgi:hypothetical protein